MLCGRRPPSCFHMWASCWPTVTCWKDCFPLKCLGTLYHSFLLNFVEKYLFLLFSVKHRFTKIIKILMRMTLCRFVHSPAGLATPARGPVKGSTPAHSTWCRPTTTRYAHRFRRNRCSLFLGTFGGGEVCCLCLCFLFVYLWVSLGKQDAKNAISLVTI